jgi:FMN-dependent oxidoreductase (nitrilotriacetate monooxygenase family)
MPQQERSIRLSAFVTAGPGRSGGWRHPESVSGWLDAEYYRELARVLERGLFDFAFFADILAVPRAYADSIEGQLRYGALGSLRLSPLPVLGVMAEATDHLGLAATISTTYAQPFAVARDLATLDHLSRGRVAWNVVTSFQRSEAANFGSPELLEKSARYRRAEEFLEVAAKLWDSWPAESLTFDKESGDFADHTQVEDVDHAGEWFSVQGPLNVPRPPQGYPVILQAGASSSGKDFAARWADAIFCSHASLESAQEFYAEMRDRARAHGRDPDQLKILPSVTPVVADTEEAAQRKASELADLVPDVAGLSQLAYHLDTDLSKLPLDEHLPELNDPSIDGHYREVVEITRREGLTLRELGKQYGGRTEGGLIGTATQIADRMEEWFTAGACDGFTVGAVYQPGAFAEFVEAVVPELQRRGLYRTSYEGTTLRDRLGLEQPERGAWRKRAQR